MIRRTAAALLGGLAVVVAIPGVASAATPEDVDGFWTSVDTDGSNQILIISELPGGQFSAFLFDDYASVCGGGPAIATGNASLSGETLTTAYEINCFNGTDAAPAEVDHVYDDVSNTLTDEFGVVWTHVFG